MWPYWLVFLFPAILAIYSRRRLPSRISGVHSLRLNLSWLIAVILFSIVIGFRFEVGADWDAYLGFLYRARMMGFLDSLALSDPGYQAVNWLSASMGWGIAGVNLASGFVFSLGLAVFCRSMPRPWLAMTVAVPYLLIVVAMGYSRQGMALGFAMLGLVSLGRQQNFWFVVWVLLAAACHKSALLLLPIAALASTRNRYWTAIWVGAIGLVAYFVLLEEHVDRLYNIYIEAEYQSQGAYIRLAMNAVPAVLLLIFRRRFPFAKSEAPLWRWFALISLGMIPLLFVVPSTTAVDRVALYMLPLQLVVFTYLPDVLKRYINVSIVVVGVVFYYAVVQFVWLNYANHAEAWLPYQIAVG